VRNDTDAPERLLAESYDTTPYAGSAYYGTHPALLAAFGYIHGLTPPSPEECRVLELGCGDGSNIIPIAYDLPNSDIIGIDLSSVQIRFGQQKAHALGLKNIRLETRSLTEVGPADGKFDYIIAHGVYSWVPDRVKRKILGICSENLSDHGIAYISYNVLPGWQFNKFMRDMMCFRARHLKNPKDIVDAALDLMHAMLEATEKSHRFHHAQLRVFADEMKTYPVAASYLLHEYMEADNDPFYFHEFAESLEEHALQYICDADQKRFEQVRAQYPDAVSKFEKLSHNGLEVAQYIDFLNNTRFRRSLICHAGMAVDANYCLGRMMPLYAATEVVPILDSPENAIRDATLFKAPGDQRFRTEHPLPQAILRRLTEIKPCTIDIPSLIQAVEREFSSDYGAVRNPSEKIGHVLHSLFFNGVVELLAAPRRCTVETGDTPTASPLARLLASSGRVTNLCHRTIAMDDAMAVFVLMHLDGTRNRESLSTLVLEAVEGGRVTIPNITRDNESSLREYINEKLETIIPHLYRCGLMVG
jgi:methyltransferase-like protein/SAM-dependent methyltransferase